MKKPKIIEIAKGINLNIISTNRFKSSRMSAFVLRPLSKENNTKLALLCSVLRSGTENFPTRKEISVRLDNLYGAELMCYMDKKGETQAGAFCINFLSDRYRLDETEISQGVADLLCEILLKPKITDGAFDREIVNMEKENLRKRIESQINDKRSYAITRCAQLMCEGEPYALSENGELEDIDLLDEKNLLKFYKEMLETSKIELFYTGDMDENKLINIFKTAFEGISRGELAETDAYSYARIGETRRIEEVMEMNQCKLTIGMRSGITAEDADFPAMVMANTVFGGGPVSKLFLNVREKLSLCYYAASRFEKFKGIILVYSGVEAENTDKAIDEINKQLNLLKNGEVTENEYAAAKLAVINSIQSVYDSKQAMEDFYLGQTLIKSRISLEEYMEKIKGVTLEQAVEASKKITADLIYVLKGEEEQ